MKKLLIATFLPALFAGAASATTVFSNSGVVTTPTNVATFNSLTSDEISLSAYQEDGIYVTVPDVTFVNFTPFSNGGATTGFHYGSGGNNSWVTISLVGGGNIGALDFLLGDGFIGITTTNFIWETFFGTTSTGFGEIALNKGTTVGWSDSVGFTSIRVAANIIDINSFGQYQAIALDNIRISSIVNNVPEPSSLALFGLGLAALGFSRKRRAQLTGA